MSDLRNLVTLLIESGRSEPADETTDGVIRAVLDDMDARAMKLPPSWPATICEFTADVRVELNL